MSTRATGTFEVTINSQPPHDAAEGATLARATLDKKFQGGLVGSSAGEMLSAVSAVKGSAGYVAIERVTGSLAGKTGTFVLQHLGAMTRGESTLWSVTVVPDSATGELLGLSGKMTIDIVEGKHLYTLEYTLGT